MAPNFKRSAKLAGIEISERDNADQVPTLPLPHVSFPSLCTMWRLQCLPTHPIPSPNFNAFCNSIAYEYVSSSHSPISTSISLRSTNFYCRKRIDCQWTARGRPDSAYRTDRRRRRRLGFVIWFWDLWRWFWLWLLLSLSASISRRKRCRFNSPPRCRRCAFLLLHDGIIHLPSCEFYFPVDFSFIKLEIIYIYLSF